MEKILIPLLGKELAPRFDLAPEVLIVSVTRETSVMGKISERTVKLDEPSSETMYKLIISETIQTILCAGIEKEVYEFLKRKGITVIDNICGAVDPVLEAYLVHRLTPGHNYF
ncbi:MULTISPECIES: NifB/NifX family molybdenum-iron cluster-binding protein [unclassified Pseudodesulfovibrio]|uniref:NifB/NifX family molybdenum-iron cluster-binding protein n=1 Tax=unclassified Pseudodesulfovibrio TaxID=2661612 RepID=UPI000FEBBE5D|nr:MULTISPECIES: NifB/NifX family molybdenum-iron cluster-binding protein [unclassified Pseudodesulfovibrio]MCJ2165007.1 NifB/NifX family molybdenum-iron cluster-binding protein [Pseudodesulfovibrio sp. S3-i]RWU03553.1 dinitrogenase iron-molybdenum cofactor biosynthesis protein [Pseudodesulfovibrio sp. S3]